MAASLNPYRILPLPLRVKTKPRPLAAHWRAPVLSVPWNSFRNSLPSSLHALFAGPHAPKRFLGGNYFRDCWVERGIPLRALALGAVLHVVFFLLPYPKLTAAHRAPLPQLNVGLTWSSPARDLPPLDLPGAHPNPRPSSNRSRHAPLPEPKGADAYEPRQTILTDSRHPTHPRQTLINSAAPPEPPKILPSLPNIVQLAQAPQPARPRLLLDRAALARLRPKQQAPRLSKDVPLPQVPNLEKQPGDLNLAASSDPVKPVLPLNASAAPRLAPRAAPGDAGPAPQLQSAAPNSGGSQTFIALSSAPASPVPQLPLVNGNLSARLVISPEGAKPGAPAGTTSNSATVPSGVGSAGKGNPRDAGNGPGVSISGGSPAATSPIAGSGGAPAKITGTSNFSAIAPERPSPRTFPAHADATHKTPSNFAAVPPGAKPESILGPKKIYTLHVNMPNLSSATGSWILSFTESTADAEHLASGVPHATAELNGPVPLRKVDPKYPPVLIQEKVEGEVVLYAVIRKDGSVDSIQLVSGLDDQLDLNAMQAFSGWKFRPAQRAGSPIELEAIVHIPFRIVHSRF